MRLLLSLIPADNEHTQNLNYIYVQYPVYDRDEEQN